MQMQSEHETATASLDAIPGEVYAPEVVEREAETGTGCCAPAELASCCAPEEKAGCCGTASAGSCGCR
jgi:hypothetical protein